MDNSINKSRLRPTGRVSHKYISGQRKIMWECLCECGNTLFVIKYRYLNGHTKSCGCLARDNSKNINYKDGRSNTPTYRSYRSMLTRCYNDKFPGYTWYGGRGITVCDRWLNSFENFYSDMGKRPEGKTLDRIDNDGNYEPSNCRWSNATTQASNKQNSVKISYDGMLYSVAALARKTGISRLTISTWRNVNKYSESRIVELIKDRI